MRSPGHGLRRTAGVPGWSPVAAIPSLRLRLTAFSLYDFADSAFATTIVTVLYSQFYAGTVAGGQGGVRILGHTVPGGTLFAWLIALSMAVVAITAPFLGVLADRRRARLRLLAACWLPGTVLTFALAGVGPGDWLSGGLIFVGAYILFGAASVLYNSLLPELGPAESLGGKSGVAWGVGYVGGALLLVLNLVMLRAPERLGFAAGAFDLSDCFASAALWWFVFALPLFAVFRYADRPVAPAIAPASATASASSSAPTAARVAATGPAPPGIRAQVKASFRLLSDLPNLRVFFLAYLLYNDAVQVVVSMASIFGAEILGLEPAELIALFLMIQGTAFVGSLSLGPLADRIGHKQVLLVCVGAWTLTTLWGAGVGIFGAPVREYWILGGISGVFLGGIQSCSRSLLAHWIPPGRESELFGFFSIMTRAASIFGPLLYGLCNLITGSLRGATLTVTVFFLAGGVLLTRLRPQEIPAERKRLEAAPDAGA